MGSLWCLVTAVVWEPAMRQHAAHCSGVAVDPYKLWLVSYSILEFVMMFQDSLVVGMAVLLTSTAPIFKVLVSMPELCPTWEFLQQYQGLLFQERPICQSLRLLRYLTVPHSHAHTPCMSTHSPFTFTHTLSLPHYHPADHHIGICSPGFQMQYQILTHQIDIIEH